MTKYNLSFDFGCPEQARAFVFETPNDGGEWTINGTIVSGTAPERTIRDWDLQEYFTIDAPTQGEVYSEGDIVDYIEERCHIFGGRKGWLVVELGALTYHLDAELCEEGRAHLADGDRYAFPI